jgi:Ca2+/H+ antiporter
VVGSPSSDNQHALRRTAAAERRCRECLAPGSAITCVGLTIPVVAVASFVLAIPPTLGLDAKSMVLLAVSFAVCVAALAPG